MEGSNKDPILLDSGHTITKFLNKDYDSIMLHSPGTESLDRDSGPSLVFYPQPIQEWLSLSHDEIGQSAPSLSCYLH